MLQQPLRQSNFELDLSNKVLDEYLTKMLDVDSVLRLKAVEASIHFFRDKSPTEKQFHDTYNQIYQFYGNDKELHQRGVSN